MNQVALITGGTRGIGLGVAKSLANEGCDLVLNGIRPESEVKNIIGEFNKTVGQAYYVQGNVGIEEDRSKIMRFINDRYGRLNVLINNAGIAPRQRRDILESTLESYEEVIRINLTGAYFLTQKAAVWMIDQQQNDPSFKGMIINISSISATVASVNRGEYCVSKAGLSMVTQLFAVRLGEYNIPVYEIRPGIIDTDMTAKVKDKYNQLIQEGLSIQKRWGKPEDVGKVVASLVREDLPYSTGQVIMVDGGLTIPRL